MEDLKESLEIDQEETEKEHLIEMDQEETEKEYSTEMDQEETEKEYSTEMDQKESKDYQSKEENIIVNITENTIESIKENPPEAIENTSSESVDIKNEDANTTNCLALTIQEEHKLTAIKNVFFRTIRMSWKVAVSTITLALIKLFS